MLIRLWHITLHLLTTSRFNCRHRITYSCTSASGRIGVDFNGRFLAGCCWQETYVIAKRPRLNQRLFVWSFSICKNDIITWVSIFHRNTSSTSHSPGSIDATASLNFWHPSINHRLHTSQVSDVFGSHRCVAVYLLLVNTQRHICANRIHHSLGWCEASGINNQSRSFSDLWLFNQYNRRTKSNSFSIQSS